MRIHQVTHGSRRSVLRAALVAALGVGGVVATATAASASPPYHTVAGTSSHFISENNDSLVVAVANAANWGGAPVIQWSNTGGSEQRWYFDTIEDSSNTPYPYEGFTTLYLLRNANSGLCLDTDGRAGDQLFQAPCDVTDYGQWFGEASYWFGNEFYDVGSALWLDVSGNSYGLGAAVDEWTWNGNGNQVFTII
jgi:hypothetical protein